jgi:hydroxyacylglutathione hydrolase
VADYTIAPIVSQPFGQLAYLAWRNGRDDAVVVDPGFDTDSLLEKLRRHHLDVAAILNTHGHLDHIAGNEALKRAFPRAPLIIGRNETPLLADPALNMSASYGAAITSPPADSVVSDGERIEIAGFAFGVREIPGHSPGSVVYICEELDPPFVFGGDVLFAGSIGRTDIGGNLQQLLHGLRTKLICLPEHMVVYPGHGRATTIGDEKRSNPFVGAAAGFVPLE